MGEGMVEMTNQTTTLYSIWTKILLKKVRHRKCDPLGPVDRQDFHTCILIEILVKKVRHKKCEPLGPIDRPDFHNYMNRNFAQKSATWKVWPFGSSWQTKPSQLLLIEILLKKVRRRKCDPLSPDDRPDFHNYILMKILLKKVRRKKCDPLGPIDTQPYINRNFAQKSAT